MGSFDRGLSLCGLIQEHGLWYGVEIGVAAGKLTRFLLHNNPMLNLVAVDYWPPDYPFDISGVDCVGVERAFRRKEQFLDVVRDFQPRCCLYEMTSALAAGAFKDGEFDFVFIDADHSYEGCRDDIRMWAPKVRSGGWVTGHDYGRPEFPGVTKAVDERFPDAKILPGYVWAWRQS